MDTLARLGGPDLPVATCTRRLVALGARSSESGGADSATDLLEHLVIDSQGLRSTRPDASLECEISWHGPARLDHGLVASEATVQAQCGLMEVHGRDAGHPRRLGVEAASVAAGLLATQGVLAALIGRSRGIAVGSVQTSVLQAGLLLVSHYVAATTCPALPPTPSGSAPGPPFASAEGCWFEIETLDPEAWKGFWGDLGVEGPELGRAWTSFRRRYFEGRCSFPPGLHEATARRSFDEIRQLAQDWRVSLVPLRALTHVLVDPGRSGAANRLDVLGIAPVTNDVSSALAGLQVPDLPLAGLSGGPDLPLSGLRVPDLPLAGLQVPDLPLAGLQVPDLPLAGLQVVEATSRMQGPLAGLLLQMLGAQVLRVEPLGGDVGRMTPPLAGDTGSFFLAFNRRKKTIELDLTTPSGRSDLRALTTRADVFLANWRPGKAAEWGLDAEDLARDNPRLVNARASGWGNRPENLSVLGTDFLVQAFAGVAESVTPDDEAACPSRVLLTDFMGAMVTCEAVLAGLYRRERTGFGCRVESSLLGGAMALQAHVLEGLVSGHEPGRRRGRPVWSTLDRPLATVDGYLALSVDDDRAFRRVCEVCDTAPHASTPELLALRISLASGAHWEKLMADAGVPCSVVCTDLSELPSDPGLCGLFEPLAEECQAPASPWGIC